MSSKFTNTQFIYLHGLTNPKILKNNSLVLTQKQVKILYNYKTSKVTAPKIVKIFFQ